MFVQFCLVVLALSSLTAASDPACEELLKPLEDWSQLSGKWILYAATSDNKDLLEDLKAINSSWIEFSPIPDSDDMTLHWGDKADGECHHGAVTSNFGGNSTKVSFYSNSSNQDHVGKHLQTCPNCILWTDSSVSEDRSGETREGRNIYLFTKSGNLDPSDLEVFKKQAACLNFPPEFHFGETTDLCPYKKSDVEIDTGNTR